MTGIETIRTSTGYPYAGGAPVVFAREDVAAIGKSSAWGDAITRLLVRLRDGRELCVTGTEQADDDRKWLYRAGRPLQAPLPPRWSYAVVWLELS